MTKAEELIEAIKDEIRGEVDWDTLCDTAELICSTLPDIQREAFEAGYKRRHSIAGQPVNSVIENEISRDFAAYLEQQAEEVG